MNGAKRHTVVIGNHGAVTTAAEAVIEGAALRLTVQAILEELPEDQQAALRQRYWLDIPLDEAGRKAHDAALRALRHPSRSKDLRQML